MNKAQLIDRVISARLEARARAFMPRRIRSRPRVIEAFLEAGVMGADARVLGAVASATLESFARAAAVTGGVVPEVLVRVAIFELPGLDTPASVIAYAEKQVRASELAWVDVLNKNHDHAYAARERRWGFNDLENTHCNARSRPEGWCNKRFGEWIDARNALLRRLIEEEEDAMSALHQEARKPFCKVFNRLSGGWYSYTSQRLGSPSIFWHPDHGGVVTTESHEVTLAETMLSFLSSP